MHRDVFEGLKKCFGSSSWAVASMYQDMVEFGHDVAKAPVLTVSVEVVKDAPAAKVEKKAESKSKRSTLVEEAAAEV